MLNKREEKGITLVALVVTIIVLLILAGVSINLVIGDKGIITRSKEAAEKYQEAAINEQIAMNETVDWMEKEIGGTGNGGSSVAGEEISPAPVGWDTGKVKPIDDGKGSAIPLPKDGGFTYVTGDKDTGVVVKDSVGNEWVWVPVTNTSYMFLENGISSGKHAGRLYTQNYSVFLDLTLTGQTFDPIYGEPMLISPDSGQGLTESAMQAEFNNMKLSVEKYSGFYIARYETGNLHSTPVTTKKGETVISNASWYTMKSNTELLYSSNLSVNSSMIWGCQWDQTMRWMENVKNKNDISKQYVYDSNGMGNYSGTPAATGSNDDYMVKNVYDMAGNVNEWTLQGAGILPRVARGGDYMGTYKLAGGAYGTDVTSNYPEVGCRMQMYIIP